MDGTTKEKLNQGAAKPASVALTSGYYPLRLNSDTRAVVSVSAEWVHTHASLKCSPLAF